MLKILHGSYNQNLPLKEDTLTGDIAVDSLDAYVLSLKGGKVATIDTSGDVALMDGADLTMPFAGFIVNDAAGYGYENKPALASKKVPVSSGNQVAITDQLADGITFAPADFLYAGTGADIGLVTNVEPAVGAAIIGVAKSVASPASPELEFYV